ncbi:MAG: metallophosphoesterase [Gemmatimonadota bacterium]
MREHGANDHLLRIGAVGDFHCRGPEDVQELTEIFTVAARECDVLLLAGDMTTHGQPEQMREFVRLLSGVDIPVLAVLGNHDHETDQAAAVAAVLKEAGVQVLDGDAAIIQGVGFVGTKGFGGGFGRHALASFGERETKAFVDAAIAEVLKLEIALADLRTETKVVLLHYTPIPDTLGAEPEQIWPFLGSSRLLPPIETYGVSVVFHGHAHIGIPEAQTPQGVPVFNVALPVLRSLNLPLRIWSAPAPERRQSR